MYKRLRWMLNADKISPEVPLTYWMLNFPTLMRFLCKKKYRRQFKFCCFVKKGCFTRKIFYSA